MSKLLLAVLALLSSPAWGQGTQYYNRPDAGTLSGSEMIGPVRQGSVDVRITPNTLRTFILASPSITGGTRITGDQSLTVTPQGSPLASRASVWRTATSVASGQQQFFFGDECLSQNAASALGGNVCSYSYIKGTAGSGGVWSRSDVTELTSTFPYSTQSAIGHEIDINNSAADRSDFGVANNVGLLINGLGHVNTAGISIQTGNALGSSSTPIWYHGVYLGPQSVKQYGFHDTSNDSTSIMVEGTHAGIGLDLSGATIAGAGIRLGAGFAQGIYVRNNVSTYSVLTTDSTGQAYIGSTVLGNVFSNGNVTPSATNTYALGASTQRWQTSYMNSVNVAPGSTNGITVTPSSTAYTLLYSDSSGRPVLGSASLGNTFVAGNFGPITDATYALGATGTRFTNTWTNNINGVPVTIVSTPASSTAPCVAGQMAMDAAYHYDCVATNTWRRAATSTW